MTLESNFLTAIKDQNLIQKGDHLLVAVSGGADSVALLLLLKSIEESEGIKLSAFHLNHQLRGDQADRDEVFVESLCRRLMINCYAFSENIEGYAKETGQSFETAARDRRYALMDQLRKDKGVQKIALAHHLNDQVETFFQRLMRGAGLDGLTGMEWMRDGVFIRPLLSSTRENIETYLDKLNQDYCIDETNADVHYLRNRIRHELIPYLEKHFNQNAVQRIGHTMRLLHHDKMYLENVADTWISEHLIQEGAVTRILLAEFKDLQLSIAQRVLRQLFAQVKGDLIGLESQHIEEILTLIEGKRHNRTKSFQNIFFTIDREWLRIEKGKSELVIKDYAYILPERGELIINEASMRIRVELFKKNEFKGDKSEDQIILSADGFHGPLVIRNRRGGDAIQLKGMKGRKKIKALFSEMKFSDLERSIYPIISDDMQLIWVYGGFLAESHYVKEDTEIIMCLTFEKL